MKKTLAILLSCVLVVAAFFAVTMLTSAAEETYATSVQVTLADGSKVTLGAQSGDSVINYLTLNAEGMSGTMTFADGVLTLNNVSGLKRIYCDTGSLVVVAEGTNTITYDGNNGAIKVQGSTVKGNNLIIKGSGILNVTSKGTVLACQNKDLFFDGSVTVNVAIEGSVEKEAIYVGNDLYVAGSATVNVEANTTGTPVTPFGSVYISGGSLNIRATGKSKRGLNVEKNLVVSSGELKVTGDYGENAIRAKVGMYVSGTGSVTVNASGTNVVTADVFVSGGTISITGSGYRAIDGFTSNKKFELSGGVVNTSGTYATGGCSVRANNITITGGTLTDTSNASSPIWGTTSISVYGGSINLNGQYTKTPFVGDKYDNPAPVLNLYGGTLTVSDSTEYTAKTLGVTTLNTTGGGTAPTPTAVPTGSSISAPTSNLPSKNFTGTTTAAVGGNSVSTGNPYVTEKGVYWVAGNTMTVSKDIFAQVNASLSEDIALTYYVVPVTGAAGVTFTINNRPTTVTDYDVDAATGLYAYRFDGIAPQEMADNIAAVLEGTEYTKAEYSVRAYLTKLRTENDSNDKMVALIDNLLAYGGAAQTYLKMTDTISGDITGTAFDATGLSSVVDSEYKAGQNFKFTAATVYFDGVNSLAFQFTGDLTGKTVKLNSVETEYKIIQGSLVTPGIKATDFDKAYTVSVWDGATELASVTYSVNSYVYAKQSGSDISTLAQRTYMYGLAAEAYAGK